MKYMDQVNHPSHYTAGGIECIEAIKASMTPAEFEGYLKGNCIKYLWRYKHKGGMESLQKCEWYLHRLIEALRDERSDTFEADHCYSQQPERQALEK